MTDQIEDGCGIYYIDPRGPLLASYTLGTALTGDHDDPSCTCHCTTEEPWWDRLSDHPHWTEDSDLGGSLLVCECRRLPADITTHEAARAFVSMLMAAGVRTCR